MKKINNLDPERRLIESNDDRPWQKVIARDSKFSATTSLHWNSDKASHTDILFLDSLDARLDFFPAEIEMQLSGKKPGDIIQLSCTTEQLLPDHEHKQHRVKNEQFNRSFHKSMHIEPRLGRFYPQGIFSDIPNVFASDIQPCRIIELDEKNITADFSHPLAGRNIELQLEINQIWDAGAEHGGRSNGVAERVCHDGPGMQARFANMATDFFSDEPYARIDARDDTEFYAHTRMVQHLDSSCCAHLRQLYSELLPGDGKILDLMASHDSHLPDNFTGSVTGLGMNAEELEANAVLQERLLHNLNTDTSLPFADASFDAVICTASFEYLTQPDKILNTLARILKPGGTLVLTFSNRWFPAKAIRLWGELHEFERMGFISELLIANADFKQLNTLSARGLPRPQDDQYADTLLLSDPLYAIWATRC
jgi:SAM-dependent methyltransferase